MLLLKTIRIFLKNKEKELGIFNLVFNIIMLIGIVFVIASILVGIGYLGLYIDPALLKNTVFENHILSKSVISFWALVFAGILFSLFIASLLGIFLVSGVILYGMIQLTFYIIEWSPTWYSDFKWFIVGNWRIAQLQSGKNEKYLIGFTKKDGSTWYLYNSASHLMFYSKDQVIRDLKDIFLVYSEVFFFDKEYAYGGYKLDEDFKRLIKIEKLSRQDFGFIKVSEFCKENKI